MIGTTRKYHLRKEVYYVVPIALLIATFLSLLIINNKRMESTNISQQEVESSLAIEEIQEVPFINEYFDNMNSRLLNRQRDNTVKYYASKFKLNLNETLKLVHEYTKDYTDEEYLQNFVIGPQSVKDKMGSLGSEEAGIIYFVRDLYRWPEKYGKTIEEMRLSEECTIDRNIVDGKIILNNGLTYEQFVSRMSNVFGLNPKLVLAISYLETGYLKSGLFVYNNNVGGMKGYDGWMEFTTLEAGAIAHVVAVKSIADAYQIDLNSETAISELSSVYVNGFYGKPDAHWTEKVSTIFNNINDEDLQY